jgi:hypothetical protein
VIWQTAHRFPHISVVTPLSVVPPAPPPETYSCASCEKLCFCSMNVCKILFYCINCKLSYCELDITLFSFPSIRPSFVAISNHIASGKFSSASQRKSLTTNMSHRSHSPAHHANPPTSEPHIHPMQSFNITRSTNTSFTSRTYILPKSSLHPPAD